MAKVSKRTAAHVEEFPTGKDHHEDLEGYTVNIVEVREDTDLTPLMKGLPDDRCQCPHWGYVFKGKLTWIYGDRTEVVEAGEAFYAPPGHGSSAAAGTEFVQFSPAEELAETEAVLSRNAQAMQQAAAE